jgi:hypothetical protein
MSKSQDFSHARQIQSKANNKTERRRRRKQNKKEKEKNKSSREKLVTRVK